MKIGSWWCCVDYCCLNNITKVNPYLPLHIDNGSQDHHRVSVTQLPGAVQWLVPDGTHPRNKREDSVHLGTGPVAVLGDAIQAIQYSCHFWAADGAFVWYIWMTSWSIYLFSVAFWMISEKFSVPFIQQAWSWNTAFFWGMWSIITDRDEITAVHTWQRSQLRALLQSFLGMASYHFLDCQVVCWHCYPTLPPERKMFQSSTECDGTVQWLQKALTTAPVLAFPDSALPFMVHQ